MNTNSANKRITGSVQPKNNRWYIILNLYDDNNKRKPKWINTNLPIRGNKKNAESILESELEKYNNVQDYNKQSKFDKLLFCEYSKLWLSEHKNDVVENSFASDQNTINVHLYPYFLEKNILLRDIKSENINQYFKDKMEGYNGRKSLSGTSLRRHYATISSILSKAINDGYITKKQVDKIQKPRCDTKTTFWYTAEQIQELIDLLKQYNSKLYVPVVLASCFGLRRQEVVGIKTEDIDFNNHILSLNHSVTSNFLYDETKNKRTTKHIKRDSLKSKSSVRTYPIYGDVEEALKELLLSQKYYKEMYGNCYNTENEDYLFVHENGDLITPDYITHTFNKFIKKHGLEKITFHGLRHSNASILLHEGYSMKEVQEWLGHADYTTTAKTYAHIYPESKNNMANSMSKCISI